MRSLIITILFLNSIASSAQQNIDAAIIKTEAGLISGSKNVGGDIRIFKGIPFAAPPLAAFRWKAPQPLVPWVGVKKCLNFGPSAMQNKPVPFSMWSQEFLIPTGGIISEDCLYLNVWTNAKNAKAKLPVVVWIYGGGFTSGGSAAPIYDGEASAKKGVVFVSINYRVGIFGFFAHPQLTKESGKNASGNYGLMDQIAALKWVQKNIAAFGGDADNVTIAGQSAGSMSVNCLVASPLAKNLFNKAIAESGASVMGGSLSRTKSLTEGEQAGEKLMQSVKLNTLKELRNADANLLMKENSGLRMPIIDGYVLPNSLESIFAAAKENKVALLTGWNQDEGLIFEPIKNAKDYISDLNKKYGTEAEPILKYYPATTDAEAAISQLNLSRDMIFGLQNYTWANIQSKRYSKLYVYRFTHKLPATGEAIKYGAFHTGEVPYFLNNLKFVDRPWQKIDHVLAGNMSDYWINFIRTGNPNGTAVADWKAYSSAEKSIKILGDEQRNIPIPDREALDLLYNIFNKK